MDSIIPHKNVENLSKKLKRESKKIVLAGGCFDILHLGHVTFLEKAKRLGDILIVLLESDQKVRLTKGEKRPHHKQKFRAKVLAALNAVDYVITLPFFKSNSDYDKVLETIKPNIIATTYKDPQISHKKRTAKLIGAKVIYVMRRLKGYSTSKILSLSGTI